MRRYTVEVGDQRFVIDVKEIDFSQFRVAVNGQTYRVLLVDEEDVPEAVIRPEILPDMPATAEAVQSALPALEKPPQAAPTTGPHAAGPLELRAPMPGTVVSVDVSPGQRVQRGQQLLALEAMKMKNAIRAPRDAVIARVEVQPGQPVHFDDPLLTFEAS